MVDETADSASLKNRPGRGFPPRPGRFRCQPLSCGNLALEVNRLVDWPHGLWSRRYQAIVVSDEEQAQVGRFFPGYNIWLEPIQARHLSHLGRTCYQRAAGRGGTYPEGVGNLDEADHFPSKPAMA